MIAGAAAALALARLDGEEEQRPRDWYVNPALRDPRFLVSSASQSVITRDEDRAFVTWRSERGLCASLVFPRDEGATSCGMPVVGGPRETRGPEHLVVGGTYQGRPDDDLWLDGVAAANVSRVEVELTDGRRLQAPIYDAPAGLGLDLKFFLVRTRPPEEGATEDQGFLSRSSALSSPTTPKEDYSSGSARQPSGEDCARSRNLSVRDFDSRTLVESRSSGPGTSRRLSVACTFASEGTRLSAVRSASRTRVLSSTVSPLLDARSTKSAAATTRCGTWERERVGSSRARASRRNRLLRPVPPPH